MFLPCLPCCGQQFTCAQEFDPFQSDDTPQLVVVLPDALGGEDMQVVTASIFPIVYCYDLDIVDDDNPATVLFSISDGFPSSTHTFDVPAGVQNVRISFTNIRGSFGLSCGTNPPPEPFSWYYVCPTPPP